MKLELKHLAGYLPYGLKFDGKRNGWVDFDSSVKNLCPMDLDGRWEVIKPILHPLSDLTKEIEVNGEKFVPVDWFEHDSVADYFDGNIWVIFLFEDGKCKDLDLIPFGMIQKLLEWHFDVYGLIPVGLAIDINTIN